MAISAASRSQENCNGSENCMSDQKKYWVNPNGRACEFLKKYEQKTSETQDNPKRRGREVIEIKSDNLSPSAEQCSTIGLKRPSTKKPSERRQQRRAANATQEKPSGSDSSANSKPPSSTWSADSVTLLKKYAVTTQSGTSNSSMH